MVESTVVLPLAASTGAQALYLLVGLLLGASICAGLVWLVHRSLGSARWRAGLVYFGLAEHRLEDPPPGPSDDPALGRRAEIGPALSAGGRRRRPAR